MCSCFGGGKDSEKVCCISTLGSLCGGHQPRMNTAWSWGQILSCLGSLTTGSVTRSVCPTGELNSSLKAAESMWSRPLFSDRSPLPILPSARGSSASRQTLLGVKDPRWEGKHFHVGVIATAITFLSSLASSHLPESELG